MAFKTFYKIVEKDRKSDGYLTLYHGVRGSRKLVIGKWVKAEIKPGKKDGTSKNSYTTGFHIFIDRDKCCLYLKKFKNMKYKRIVMGEAKGIRPKPTSSKNSGVYLANQIRITMDTTWWPYIHL